MTGGESLLRMNPPGRVVSVYLLVLLCLTPSAEPGDMFPALPRGIAPRFLTVDAACAQSHLPLACFSQSLLGVESSWRQYHILHAASKLPRRNFEWRLLVRGGGPLPTRQPRRCKIRIFLPTISLHAAFDRGVHPQYCCRSCGEAGGSAGITGKRRRPCTH